MSSSNKRVRAALAGVAALSLSMLAACANYSQPAAPSSGPTESSGAAVALVQPGKVLYEMEGVPEDIAREAFRLAAAKLPIRTTVVERVVL